MNEREEAIKNFLMKMHPSYLGLSNVECFKNITYTKDTGTKDNIYSAYSYYKLGDDKILNEDNLQSFFLLIMKRRHEFSYNDYIVSTFYKAISYKGLYAWPSIDNNRLEYIFDDLSVNVKTEIIFNLDIFNKL